MHNQIRPMMLQAKQSITTCQIVKAKFPKGILGGRLTQLALTPPTFFTTYCVGNTFRVFPIHNAGNYVPIGIE